MTTPHLRILLVEDSIDDAFLLRRALREGPFDITHVETLGDAAAVLRSSRFDVVLLDLSLPDSKGFDTFAQMREHARDAAVVVLTGLDDEALGLKTVQAGAQDYLVKGSLGAGLLARSIRHSLERKRSQMVNLEYARALAARNAEMREDLQLAREVQQSFVPERCPTFPLGSERPTIQFAQRYVPAGAVGGDFFDVFALSRDVAGIIICDVMGHGVRAALITAMLRALVGPQAAAAPEPAAMLNELNDRLRQIFKAGESVMFVTAVYLVINALTGEVRLANAGHPKPTRIGLDGAVSVLATKPAGPPMGLVERPKYETERHQLTASDRVLLFTDGVYEVEGAGDASFGQARLFEALSAAATLPAPAFLEAVLARAKAHSVTGELTDDACLLTIDFRRPTALF